MIEHCFSSTVILGYLSFYVLRLGKADGSNIRDTADMVWRQHCLSSRRVVSLIVV